MAGLWDKMSHSRWMCRFIAGPAVVPFEASPRCRRSDWQGDSGGPAMAVQALRRSHARTPADLASVSLTINILF